MKVFFPVTDVTLRGVLADVDVVLRGVSEAFAYRENSSARAALILSVQNTIADAIKEATLFGGIWLDAGEVSLFAQKEASITDGALVLSALISTAIQKTVSMLSAARLSGKMGLEANRTVAADAGEVALGAELAGTESTKAMAGGSAVWVAGQARSLKQDKEIGPMALALVLQGVFRECLNTKDVVPAASAMTITGSMSAVARRYRTIGDLAGLSIGDVQGWTLYQFYYKEE